MTNEELIFQIDQMILEIRALGRNEQADIFVEWRNNGMNRMRSHPNEPLLVSCHANLTDYTARHRKR